MFIVELHREDDSKKLDTLFFEMHEAIAVGYALLGVKWSEFLVIDEADNIVYSSLADDDESRRPRSR